MALLANIKKLIKDIPQLNVRVGAVALQRGEALQKQRIFSDGQCTDGASISSRRQALPPNDGDYSASHGRKRRDSGRQTGYVDLELTGRHRRNMVVGEDSSGNAAYGFLDSGQKEIAEGHTEYRRKDIYPFSESELREVTKAAVTEVRTWVKEIFND